MAVGNHPAIRSGNKSSAEHVDANLRPGPLKRQNRIAIAILNRLALRIQPGIVQPLAGYLFP